MNHLTGKFRIFSGSGNPPAVRRMVVGTFLAALAFQVGLQEVMRPHAANGIYFQGLPSETMRQTVSIADLRDRPLESLWNLHIQPPALDAIRAE